MSIRVRGLVGPFWVSVAGNWILFLAFFSSVIGGMITILALRFVSDSEGSAGGDESDNGAVNDENQKVGEKAEGT